MNILAIDSHSTSGSIAIASGGQMRYLAYLDIKGTHSTRLMKMIDQALRICALAVKDIDQIVLSIGPGSFTGIRIGLATAKGLSFAHNIPIVPVCSLEMRAMALANCGKNIISFCDAKTKEIYASVYDQSLTPLVPAGCYNCEKFFGELTGDYFISGDNYQIIQEHSQHLHLSKATLAQSIPLASYLVQKSDPELKFDFDTLSNLEPMYLRKSQAEIVWEAKNKKEKN